MRRILILLLFCAGLCVYAAYAQSARDLNTTGFRLYTEGRYVEALDYFGKAIEADPSYVLAQYNYACTLGVLRDIGPEFVCRYDTYKWRILDYLEESIRLDPGRLDRMKDDPDLACVHDTFRYQRLLGLNPDDPEDALLILKEVSWYAFNAGAYGPVGGIDFHEDGTLTLWELDVTTAKVKRIEHTGLYSVSDTGMEIVLDDPLSGRRRFSLELSIDGVLSVPGLPFQPFIDDPRDCEA
ncbi:MAG: hypothetical protein JW885_01135 [Deltaproteobacteria bacterium]|nr:hypothetical protein [Candidatus Zymogenaceae bacterium]